MHSYLACAHEEGLVPDADVAVRADFLVELHPVWVVGLVAVARIRGQVFKRSPVLHIRREAQGSHPRKPLLGSAATSASIFDMVDKNHRYLGSFHHRLKRAPMMKTTKSPSIEAAMRRLIVAIGAIVTPPALTRHGTSAIHQAVLNAQGSSLNPFI